MARPRRFLACKLTRIWLVAQNGQSVTNASMTLSVPTIGCRPSREAENGRCRYPIRGEPTAASGEG